MLEKYLYATRLIQLVGYFEFTLYIYIYIYIYLYIDIDIVRIMRLLKWHPDTGIVFESSERGCFFFPLGGAGASFLSK